MWKRPPTTRRTCTGWEGLVASVSGGCCFCWWYCDIVVVVGILVVVVGIVVIFVAVLVVSYLWLLAFIVAVPVQLLSC